MPGANSPEHSMIQRQLITLRSRRIKILGANCRNARLLHHLLTGRLPGINDKHVMVMRLAHGEVWRKESRAKYGTDRFNAFFLLESPWASFPTLVYERARYSQMRRRYAKIQNLIMPVLDLGQQAQHLSAAL